MPAALVAAAVLALAAAGLYQALTRAGDDPHRSLPVTHDSATVILGAPAPSRNRALGLRATRDGRGLLLMDADATPERWPVLTYSLELPRSLQAVFVWERAAQPGQVHHKSLAGHEGALMLAGDDDWSGRIARIGLLIRPDPDWPAADDGGRVVSGELALVAGGAGHVAHAYWTRWNAFRGWTGTAINHLGPTRLPLLLAGWALAAAVLAFVLGKGRRLRSGALALAAGLGIGWLLLHGLWMHQLQRQVAETRLQFDPAGFEPGMPREPDRELAVLVGEVLALPGSETSRVALVSERRYFGERARYLLLPRSAAHFRTPESLKTALGHLAAGDMVVADADAASSVARLLAQRNVRFERRRSSPAGAVFVLGGGGREAAGKEGGKE